jgi:Transposase, Mutator family
MPPKEFDIPDELIDQLLAGRGGPEEITGPDGLLKQLTKRVVERATSAELTEHLGYELAGEPPEGQLNRRNGLSSKTLITDHGPVEVELARDRDGSFEPQIVPKHQRRFAGFDDKIVSMYGRGMTTREISKHLEEIYGVEVGRDTISRVTDAILDDVKEWQSRPLEKLYLVVWLDALVLKIRDQGSVRKARLPRGRGRDRRDQGDARDLAGAQRGRQVLAPGDQRAESPRRRGHPRLLRRRPQRLPRGDRGRLPGGDRADLHRAHDPQLAPVHQLQGPQAARQGPADDLHRAERGGRPGGSRDVRRDLGQPLPPDQPIVARRLGASDPVLRVPAGAEARRLHDG